MEKVISIPGFSNITYSEQGKGNAILLLHGFPAKGSLWNKVAPFLAEHYKVLIPDLPANKEDLCMNDLALVIHAIVNAEELSEVIIVGHSMGGYVALAFANAYPAFVRGISLVHSAAWPDSPEKKENRKRTAEIILNGAKQALIKQMVPNLFAPDFVSFYPNIISEQIAVATSYEPSELANFQLAMMNRRDSLPYITNSTIPIQWILGKKDNLIPFQQALTQIYKAQINFISSYNNCGHMAMLENPEFLSKDILNFSNYCLNHRH